MERADLLKSPEYWITKAQFDLYACAEDFMRSHNMNRTQLAEYLGVSKGYVSQLLNGDYDHKFSKLVELAIAFGVVPKIDFKAIDEVIREDKIQYSKPQWMEAIYDTISKNKSLRFSESETYEVSGKINMNVA